MKQIITWQRIVALAALSVRGYVRLVLSGSLLLRRDRIGKLFTIDQGNTYAIFRETISNQELADKPVVLVVGFRLRFIRDNRIFHWIFQRICILTTPFWSGFHGFHIKLWMVDPKTKNYLGIYEWYGKENAMIYVYALIRVLHIFSTNGSVWYECITAKKFERYLSEHTITSPHHLN